jgi:Mn2+/Fe2+ NRAMP family transporter
MLSTAATLHAHGVTDIQSSEQAAEALRPIAGELTCAVFALGIIGTGLLACPVLAGSAAYAIGEAFGWSVGLAKQPHRAKAFYGTIAGATAVGTALNFTPLDPVKALFWSAVINGVVSVPVMVLIMSMAVQPRIMGPFVLGPGLRFTGWLATIVMAVSAVGMFATWGE